jgi:hypothetical protein
MKLFAVIRFMVIMMFVTSSLYVSAQSNDLLSRRTTIQVSSIKLDQALDLVSAAYGVQFSYSSSVIPVQSLVSVNIKDNNLEEALTVLLQPFGIKYQISGTRVVLSRSRSATAQTIRGSVIDQITNTPLEGIVVSVKDSDPIQSTITTSDGRFRLANVPVGRNSLVIQSIGYEPKTIDVILGSGKELVIDITLTESVTTMKEVVVTGSRHEGVPGEGLAVTSARSFTLDETKRYAGSLGDPARMASSFAGVVAGSDESNALIVRGNSPRGVLWRIEGIEVPNPNHFASEGASNGIVSVLSSNIIDNSDFLTGSFPAQYGNALSGVFDIKLRSGNNEHREHSLQIGTLGVELATEGPIKRGSSSYLVNYRYSTLSLLDQMGVELNEVGQYKNYQDVSFKIDVPSTSAGSFSLFGIGGRSVANRTDDLLLDNNSSDVIATGLNYRKIINDRTLLQSSLSLSGTDISRFNEIVIDNNAVEVNERYSKLYTRALLTIRKKITTKSYAEAGVIHSLLNYDFYLRTLDVNSIYQQVINFSEQGNTSTTQGFLFAQHYLSPQLSAFYGAHLLYFQLSDDLSLEPRGGLRWYVTENSDLSFALGKYSRVENLQYYLARDHQTGGAEVQINKDLGFTRSNHIGVSYTTHALRDHQLKAEAYYQYLYNAPVQSDPSLLYTSINEDTGFITDTLVNSGSGKNYGVEISFDRPFSNNFYYMINASLYRSQFTVNEIERSTSYDGNYALHVLAGKEFVSGNRRNRLAFNMKTSFAGGRPYVPIDLDQSIQEGSTVFNWDQAFVPRLDNYFRMDAQVSYRMNFSMHSFELRLDIQNVTNHRNSAFYVFDNKSNRIELKRFVGIVPVLSMRVDF